MVFDLKFAGVCAIRIFAYILYHVTVKLKSTLTGSVSECASVPDSFRGNTVAVQDSISRDYGQSRKATLESSG